MPVNITDASTFTSPVVAPAGSDSRNNAANVVEALAQALANRTRFNKDTIDALSLAAARLGSANVFTRGQQVDVADNPGEALIRTTKTAHDSTSNPGNGWKLLLECKCDATRYVRLFSGANDPSGMFALTVNAYWQISGTYASKWRKDDNAHDAFALLVTGENLYVTRQDASDSVWSSWPTNQGLVSCNSLQGGAGGIYSDASVSAAGEFAYLPAKARTCYVPKLPFFGSGYALVPGVPGSSATHIVCSSAGGNPCVFPLRIPIGCTTFSLTVSYALNGSVANTFRIVAGKALFTSGGVVNDVQVATVDSDAAPGNGKKTLLVTSSPHAIDSTLEEYWLEWIGGQAGDQFFGMKALGWDDNANVRGW